MESNVSKKARKRARRIVSREELRRRELLRIGEVADLLGESRANVYLRIKRGELKTVTLGDSLRVHGLLMAVEQPTTLAGPK